jgi:catalase
VEKDHIVNAFAFELAKVTSPEIRERVLANIVNVDTDLGARVAAQLGLTAPSPAKTDGKPRRNGKKSVDKSPALSILANAKTDSIKGRKVAILAADGVDAEAIETVKAALKEGGAQALVLAPHLGELTGAEGSANVQADHRIVTEPSVVFDAVFVPGGLESARTLAASGDAVHFVAEAYKHHKAIAAVSDGIEVLREAGIFGADEDEPATRVGVAVSDDAEAVVEPFLEDIAKHRAWDRADAEAVPA